MNEDLPHILVVDDDKRLRDLLQRFLADHGFRVTVADGAVSADHLMAGLTFDLIVLDRMMPGRDGVAFARDLRARDDVPILMLTAMGETADRISGLEAGVDDYLAKPFEPRELLLRIRTILRRFQAEAAGADEIRIGRCRFDPERGILHGTDGILRLTETEVGLLRVLAAPPHRIRSREELTELCDINGGVRTVDVQVTRLRRKIEPDPRLPRYLQTVRGRGYVLRPD